MTLKIFTPQNGIYPGVNESQFGQLEYLSSIAIDSKQKFPNLGLFGESSTGKTTAVNLLAKTIGYNILCINSAGIKTASKIYNAIHDGLLGKAGLCSSSRTPSGGCQWHLNYYTIVFLDECHELGKEAQNFLLPILAEKTGPLLDCYDGEYTVSMNNVTFIFATTDSGKMLYPLVNRLFSVTFDQYTADDVANIIGLKYNNIDLEGRKILAICAKLVPRRAIQYAETLISFSNNKSHFQKVSYDQVAQFVKGFLKMELSGVDPIDKRILSYLSNNTKQIEPVDTISLKFATEALEKFLKKGEASLSNTEYKEYNALRFKVNMLTNKINTAKFIPRSRQDISLYTRLYDERDLEMRLSFLEQLGMVTKTPKGILLTKDAT